MGSFAWTCCISGLPVEHGDPVRFLALTESSSGRSRGWTNYVTDRWRLRTVPLRAKYNDYGSVEDIQPGLVEKVFFKSFSLDVVEKGIGDNSAHDVAVKRGMKPEEWLEALWEGRVEVDPVHSWPKADFDPADLDKDVPKGMPTLLRIEKVLKKAGYKTNQSYADGGVLVDEVARGFIRIRSSEWGKDKKLSKLLPLLEEYATMVTAGTGNYANSAEVLVAPRPGEGRSHSGGMQGDRDQYPIQSIQQAFVREDVWQVLLSMSYKTQYSDGPRSLRSLKEGAQKLLKDEEEHQQLLEAVKELSEDDPKKLKVMFSAMDAARLDVSNPLSFALYGPQRGLGFGLKDAFKLAQELDPKRKQLAAFLDDLAETVFVECAFADLRGQWGPTAGGAQFGEWLIHGRFHSELTKLCTKKVEEEQAEEDEDADSGDD